MVLYHKDDDESRAQSERLALSLMSNAELPMVIRVKCHLVMGSGNNDYLWHAEEAVRVMKFAMKEFGTAGDAEKALLKRVEEVLAKAKHDHDESAGADDEGEEQDIEGTEVEGGQLGQQSEHSETGASQPTPAKQDVSRVGSEKYPGQSSRQAAAEEAAKPKGKRAARMVTPPTPTLASTRARRES